MIIKLHCLALVTDGLYKPGPLNLPLNVGGQKGTLMGPGGAQGRRQKGH